MMKKIKSEYVVHIIILVVLIVIPLTLQLESMSLSMRYMRHFWVMVFGLLVAFYGNYLFALDRLFYSKKYLWFILFNVCIFLLNDSIETVSSILYDAYFPRPRRERSAVMQTMNVYYRLIYTGMGIGAAFAAYYSKRFIIAEREREELANEKLKSEIAMLKYQMQPHFFFNTLNNIYALIGKSPQDAQKAVHSLSKMMRYVLYENMDEEMDLDKEIDFVRNYNKLMLLRIGDSMKVTLALPPDVEGIRVPPLLLIPLVENAYKHGKGFINGNLSIDNGRLVFRVENGLPDANDEDRVDSGIGIQNLVKRLEIIYDDKASFHAGPTDHGTFVAQIEIPVSNNK